MASLISAEPLEEEVVVTKKTEGLTLFITIEEARALLAVLDNVGGRLIKTPRGHIDNIRKILCEANLGSYSPIEFVKGSALYFAEK